MADLQYSICADITLILPPVSGVGGVYPPFLLNQLPISKAINDVVIYYSNSL